MINLAWMSRGLGLGEPLDPGVHGLRVDRYRLEAAGVDPELVGVPIAGHHLRAGDEGLRRHTVVEHAGAAGARRLDDRHVGVQLGGDQGRLVSGGPATNDHDSSHDAIVPASAPTTSRIRHVAYSPHALARLSSSPCVITPRTARTSIPARMRAYCPHSPMVGTGWLEGWRLTFAGEDVIGWEGAVTTIVESPGDRVFVALYDVHPWDGSQLDEVEGVDRRDVPQAHSGWPRWTVRSRPGSTLQRVRGRAADHVVPDGDRQRGGEGRALRTTTWSRCAPAP